MTFEPGRIVMVAFPFTDQTATKLRPALVVSSKSYNSGQDFVAVPISSRLSQDGYPILSTASYFRQTQLKWDSTVKWRKVMTISGAVVHRQLGRVPEEVLKEIQQLIRGVFS